MNRFDAIIIGAGPAGSTAALLLVRAGWSIAIVEKTPFPRRKVCGEFISATSMPLLHELGIGDAFSKLAGPEVQQVGIFAHEAELSAPMPRAALSSKGWGRALGREHLDALLLEEAVQKGAMLLQPWSVTHVQRNQEGVTCTLEARDEQQEINAPILIMAGGSWQRGILSEQEEAPHKASDLLGFKAHFKNSALAHHLMPLLAFPGGYGGMVHSDEGRTSLSCCIRRDQLQQCRDVVKTKQAAEAVLYHIMGTTKGVRDALQDATLDGVWLSAGPIKPGIRKRYSDRVFKVGNAAGEAHPVVAEGISMAMQSSWLLCQRLIASKAGILNGEALTEVGNDFSQAWATWFSPRIRAAAVFAHLAMQPKVTRLLLPLLRQFPQLITLGAKLSGKTKQLTLEPQS